MKDILKSIIAMIVDDPSTISIEEKEEEGTTRFEITVPQAEMGRLIGKGGKVIRSIRTVMKIPAMKTGTRIDVSLVEKTS